MQSDGVRFQMLVSLLLDKHPDEQNLSLFLVLVQLKLIYWSTLKSITEVTKQLHLKSMFQRSLIQITLFNSLIMMVFQLLIRYQMPPTQLHQEKCISLKSEQSTHEEMVNLVKSQQFQQQIYHLLPQI